MEKLILLLINFLLIVSIFADQNSETENANNIENKITNKFMNYAVIRCGEGVMGWSCGSLCLWNCKNYYYNVHDNAFYSIAKKFKYYGASRKTNKDSLVEKDTNNNIRKKRSLRFSAKDDDYINSKLLRYPRPNVGFNDELGSEMGISGGQEIRGWNYGGYGQQDGEKTPVSEIGSSGFEFDPEWGYGNHPGGVHGGRPEEGFYGRPGGFGGWVGYPEDLHKGGSSGEFGYYPEGVFGGWHGGVFGGWPGERPEALHESGSAGEFGYHPGGVFGGLPGGRPGSVFGGWPGERPEALHESGLAGEFGYYPGGVFGGLPGVRPGGVFGGWPGERPEALHESGIAGEFGYYPGGRPGGGLGGWPGNRPGGVFGGWPGGLPGGGHGEWLGNHHSCVHEGESEGGLGDHPGEGFGGWPVNRPGGVFGSVLRKLGGRPDGDLL